MMPAQTISSLRVYLPTLPTLGIDFCYLIAAGNGSLPSEICSKFQYHITQTLETGAP